MTQEKELFLKLFTEILLNNDYYSGIRNSLKNEYNKIRTAAYQLADDYLNNCDFLSIYKYLDSINDYINKNNCDIDTALNNLWNTGSWNE